jgi:hypothetical protein
MNARCANKTLRILNGPWLHIYRNVQKCNPTARPEEFNYQPTYQNAVSVSPSTLGGTHRHGLHIAQIKVHVHSPHNSKLFR